ncbi:MAG TPA: SRPBCC family protein [Solirubrobacterales bacterium]|nr:SRPBCC family protein [Solirubrobacterales bacterium]
MPHNVDTVSSAMDPAELFDYMAEFSNAAEWDPGTVSARRLGDGPVGLGSRFELIVRFAGRESPFAYEITEYERPRRVVLVAETGAAIVTDTMSIAAGSGGGSVLTYDARLELKGARRLFSPLMSVLFGRVFANGRRGLEETIGSGADR